MPCVYQHIRKDKNHTFYIGVASDKRRPRSKSNRNTYWKNITSKSDYDIVIMIDSLTKEDARSWERYLIGLYGRKDLRSGNLVNMTDGGDGSINMSPELKEKLRERNSGENNYFYGKKFCGPLNAMYGKKRPDLAERGKARKGTKNPRQAELMRAKIGELNNMWGKTHSNEARNKISEAQSKKVINTETGVIYKNTIEASEQTGINVNTLRAKLIGRLKNNTPLRYF